MTDDLVRFRPEFPILERTTYMISSTDEELVKAIEVAEQIVR